MAGHRFADKRKAAAQFRRVVVTVAADIAAGQHRGFGPCRADAFVVRRQFLQRMLGQLAIGGQLAAKDRQQRRLPIIIMDIKRVIAGDRLRRVGFIVAQRAHAGVGPDDIVPRERLLKWAL